MKKKVTSIPIYVLLYKTTAEEDDEKDEIKGAMWREMH